MENDTLKEIKAQVNNGNMSFIIGAGFSKNISAKFLDWTGLLKPMVEKVYNITINDNKECKRIIDDHGGYLNVVSEYIKRKGYHEAVDVYIEKNTPYLVKNNDERYELRIKGKTIDSPPDLTCHKLLLSLGIKNIYTFNYDNTLDLLGHTDESDKIRKKEFEIDEAYCKLKSYEEKYTEKCNKLKDEKKLKPSTPNVDTVSKNEDDQCLFDDINKLKDEINGKYQLNLQNISKGNNKREENISLIQDKLSELDSSKAKYENELNACYQLITNSFDISITENRQNIYKLHGNLRVNNYNNYGFDGDHHTQYIISKEDYDSYPQRHEAFVNLMKVSLLKGYFCMIGFSGDDPNFLMWINWVKEILDKDAQRQKKFRIYYIDVNKEEIDEEKLLLLKNHYIEYVHLNKLFENADERKDRLVQFFDYIKQDKRLYQLYDDAWEEIKDSSVIKDEVISQLWSVLEYNRLPSQNSNIQYIRTSFFSKIKTLIDSNGMTENYAKIIYAAIKGEMLPISFFIPFSNLSKKKSTLSKELRDKINLLNLHSNVLENKKITMKNESNNDEISYEQALHLLFNFKFSEAKTFLTKWNPYDGISKTRRVMLLSIYDATNEKGTQDEINKCLNPDSYKCDQDFVYALDVIPNVRGMWFQCKDGVNFDADLQQPKDSLFKNNLTLHHVGDIISSLEEKLKKENEIRALGSTTITKPLFRNNNTPLINSVKILQILIEIGIPTQSKNVTLLNKTTWISICENLYEIFPYPCLYFTLLYWNEKDLITKVAQRYIYSSRLQSILPDLLSKLLKACIDDQTTERIREAIYVCSPIFMKCVPPNLWAEDFKKIYNKFKPTNTDKDNNRMRINPVYHFFVKGMELINDNEFRQNEIKFCLSKPEDIDDFYNSLIIAASKNIENIPPRGDLQKELTQLISSASESPHFYVLLNMSKYFSQDQKELLCNRFLSLDQSFYNDSVLIEGISRFAKGNQTLEEKIKNNIVSMGALWETGINKKDNSIGIGADVLDINTLQANIGLKNDNVLEIFNKLKEAACNIEEELPKWKSSGGFSPLDQWRSLLINMHRFLIQNKEYLSTNSDYQKFVKKVKYLYNTCSGDKSIFLLLSSNNPEKIQNSLESLSSDIQIFGIRKFINEYTLLAHRIILEQPEYLNLCIGHFSWAFCKYFKDFDKKDFGTLIKMILVNYQKYYRKNKQVKWTLSAKKEDVEISLINLNNKAHKWDVSNSFWSKYKPTYYR